MGNMARHRLAPTMGAQSSIYLLLKYQSVVQCESLRGYKYTVDVYLYAYKQNLTLLLLPHRYIGPSEVSMTGQ